jgi:hypothetical protein
VRPALNFIHVSFALAAAALFVSAPAALRAAPAADQPQTASCKQFMAPQKSISGKMVGQEDCMMQDAGVVDPEKKYHRVEMGVTGTLSGWLVKEGARVNHFTSMPDFVFTQYGNTRPRFHGILRYEAAKGTSLTLYYPESGWNGKFFVMVHGVGGSFRKGSMRSWDKYFNPARVFEPTKYEKAMLDKGYAVARTRRNADREAPGDYSAVLDSGEVWPDLNINQMPELIIDEARLVRNFLKERLGKDATRIYWYGHSAGAHMGLAINYMAQVNPELNRENGKPVIDGFIDDDPGGGMYIPILMKNGQDILFRTPEEKLKFVKTIVVAHQLYPNFYSEDTPWEMEINNVPKFVNTKYLANKRTTARVMKEKSMGGFRYYEVKGVSHSGGDNLPNGKDNDVEILDLSKFMDGVVDLLDNWVEKDIQPPASRSDEQGLSSSKDAIDLPETACPLGVYYPYPQLRSLGGSGSTGFAPYDGETLEPLNGILVNVDMNGNAKRDKRETVTEAWRRLGLLKAGESFDRAKYVACVQQTASKLRKENFITQSVAERYVQEAQKAELPMK